MTNQQKTEIEEGQLRGKSLESIFGCSTNSGPSQQSDSWSLQAPKTPSKFRVSLQSSIVHNGPL